MSKLYFYHSPMDAGKSAHIIMQVHNLRSIGKKVLIFKSDIDTRDIGVIRSRALKTELESLYIKEDTDIFTHVKNARPDYVFIDEVNFLSKDKIDDLAKIVDVLNIPVFAYGLLVNYKGTQFEGSKRMIELADSIRELKTSCVKCSRKATMILRNVDGEYVFEGNPIQVGDTDSYQSVCRKCYMNTKKVY